MNPTDEVVDKAIEGLKPDADTTTPPAPDSGKKPDTKPVEDTPDTGKDPKEDAGYLADDIDKPDSEDDKGKAKPAPDPEEIDTSGLNPEERFIIGGLPLITARVKNGDGVKELQVKSWTQLPDDLEFASKRDELAFLNALNAQELRARDLQQQFRADDQKKKSDDFERIENEGIRQDITDLQQTGDLPKFKLKPDEKGFNEDPTTKDVQNILNFMEERNKQFLAEYNQGRPYRHIGFREAFSMYQQSGPDKKSPQKSEDKERKDMADKVAGNKGLTARELKKPTVKPGTRVGDILDRIDREWS